MAMALNDFILPYYLPEKKLLRVTRYICSKHQEENIFMVKG